MEILYGKIIPKEQQPIRKYRTVFTSTKGLLRKQRWNMLDIDEFGMSYTQSPDYNGQMFSSMYEVLEEIILDDRAFTLTVKDSHHNIYKIDLYKLDGDLWNNFINIRDVLTTFVGNKLILK